MLTNCHLNWCRRIVLVIVCFFVAGCGGQSGSNNDSDSSTGAAPDGGSDERIDQTSILNPACERNCIDDLLVNVDSCNERLLNCVSTCTGDVEDNGCISDCHSNTDNLSCEIAFQECVSDCPCEEQHFECQALCTDQMCRTQCDEEAFACSGFRPSRRCAASCLTNNGMAKLVCEGRGRDDTTMDTYLLCLDGKLSESTACLQRCGAFPSFEQHHSDNCQNNCSLNISRTSALRETQIAACIKDHCDSVSNDSCIEECQSGIPLEIGFYNDCIYLCPCFYELQLCQIACAGEAECLDACSEIHGGCDFDTDQCTRECMDSTLSNCLTACSQQHPDNMSTYLSCREDCALATIDCTQDCVE